ncbi:MAG: small multidrug export protein [Treponematales bacterium]
MSGAAGTVLGTVLLAFLPISELRGAIPFAAARGLPWFAAYPLAVCVNALAAPACWLFLSTAHRLFYGAADGGGAGEAGGGGLRWYRRLFDRFVARARERLRPGVERWGWFGLALFVAVPLPVTGAWTGTLGAWVLGLGRRRTLAAVFLGVLISGAVVTAVTVLGVKALGVFTKQG